MKLRGWIKPRSGGYSAKPAQHAKGAPPPGRGSVGFVDQGWQRWDGQNMPTPGTIKALAEAGVITHSLRDELLAAWCPKPPDGWFCTDVPGHVGPCPAWPEPVAGRVIEDMPTEGRRYGGDKTWHQTGKVDVELDASGHVVSVWFRCTALPFNETAVSNGRASEMRDMYEAGDLPKLVAVELAD